MSSAAPRYAVKNWLGLVGTVVVLLIACALAWVSNHFTSIVGWGSFVAALALAGLSISGVWAALCMEKPPPWLMTALLAAIVLRLLAGVAWFSLLPVYGYYSPAEQAGYIMADAGERDRAAWELSASDKPLVRAFQGGYRKADQYGGLLFFSAFVYRYLGGTLHQPLLMVVFTAAFSGLAILFAWALAQRAWGKQAAKWATWGLVLYPEAVLLGSSQMREAFTVTLAAAAFYGLLRFEQDRRWAGLAWTAFALLISLPFSPPFTFLLLVLLALQALFMGEGFIRQALGKHRWFRWLLLGLVLLAVLGMWLSWARMAPPGASDLPGALRFWIKKSAEYQAHLSERASGWVQKIFDDTPSWLHLPLLVVYGILQPFLPAALADISGAWIWQAIAIWRSLGWTILLAPLVYAALRALRPHANGITRGLSLAAWIVILVAAFRSGGDAWDNPRYRAMFAALQVALAAWGWTEYRRQQDAWFRRVVWGVIIVLLWILPWYLHRYIYWPWPVTDLFKSFGLGVASAVLVWLADLYKPAQ